MQNLQQILRLFKIFLWIFMETNSLLGNVYVHLTLPISCFQLRYTEYFGLAYMQGLYVHLHPNLKFKCLSSMLRYVDILLKFVSEIYHIKSFHNSLTFKNYIIIKICISNIGKVHTHISFLKRINRTG